MKFKLSSFLHLPYIKEYAIINKNTRSYLGVIRMVQIPSSTIPYYEAGIYLPMLLIILEKDYSIVDQSPFKFKNPYLHLIDAVRMKIEHDLKATKEHFKRHQMRLVRGKTDDLFTEYHFYFEGVMECRRYSNIRLRNQSELLLAEYFEKK